MASSTSLLFAAVVLFTTTAVSSAVWRGPPQMLAALDNETQDWAKTLKTKFGGPCCEMADGFPTEWDMAGTADDTSGMHSWEARISCSTGGRQVA